MVKLDYGASVPISTAAPFIVNVDPNKPPGDQRFKDYVPNKNVAAKPQQRKKPSDMGRKPIVRYDQDYISPEDAQARKSNDKSKIMAIAKEIYKESAKKKADYEKAKALVDSTSPNVKASSDKELARAIRIVGRGKPLSKEEAVEIAEKQFYGNQSD